MINGNTLRATLNAACRYLYDNEKDLVDEHANEETIVADVLGPFLRRSLRPWHVNTNYNREGAARTKKTDQHGNLLFPDIIVHKRGPNGPNIAAIEVKGHWNREDRRIDVGALRRIKTKHGYKFLYRIELRSNSHKLIRLLY